MIIRSKLIASVFAGLMFPFLVCSQQTYVVAAGQSIQNAINKASEGDTIRVEEGTFDESLFINKSIALIGEGHDKTVISGADNGSRAYMEFRTVLVYEPVYFEGFAVRQSSDAVDNNHNKIGLLLEASGNSVIRNCFFGNHITGIYISGSKDNVIENNIFDGCGNGILFAAFMFDSDNNTIRENVISHNGIANEEDDAGIKLIENFSGSSNTITNNDIFGNTIGINNQSSTPIVANGNWWGDGTGPEGDMNPNGNGNSVSGPVIVETWFEEAVVIASVEQVPSQNTFSIYPNPAVDHVNIVFSTNQNGSFSFKFYSLTGQLLLQKSKMSLSGERKVTIPISDLSKGVYLVESSSRDFHSINRLVVD